MNILYMNQGGGGQWGAIKYSDYQLILLAESEVEKDGFSMNWKSSNTPVMSIQQNKSSGRIISDVTDIDVTAQEVRPMATFTTKDNIRVVFVHLKSGNEQLATDALTVAVLAVQKMDQFGVKRPILWIGDFNRAKGSVMDTVGAKPVFQGGGQAWWDLDRAYVSGDWSKYKFEASTPSTAGADHGHAAIAFKYSS